MLLLTSKHPQRGWQSRMRVLCAPRSGRRSLTATAAEGTRVSASRYLPRRASFYNAFYLSLVAGWFWSLAWMWSLTFQVRSRR